MINLNFLDAEGNPIPGRVPTPVIVSGGTLTKEQTGELAGIYGGYTAVMQMSLISVNMQKGVFSGGKYAIVSNGVFDTIYVELEGGDENTAPRGLGAYPKNTANNTTWNYPVVFATDSYSIVVSNPDQVAVTAEPPTYASFEPQYWMNADGDTCTVNSGLAFWCSGGDGNQYSEVEVTTVPELQPNGITTSNYMLLPVIEPDSNNKFFVSANTVYNNEGAVVHTFEADTIDNTIQQGVRKATQLPQIISEDGDEIILQAKDTLNWVPPGVGYMTKYRRQWYEVLALNSSGVNVSYAGRYDLRQVDATDLSQTDNGVYRATGASVQKAVYTRVFTRAHYQGALGYNWNGDFRWANTRNISPQNPEGTGWVICEELSSTALPTHMTTDRLDKVDREVTLDEHHQEVVGRLGGGEVSVAINNTLRYHVLCKGDMGQSSPNIPDDLYASYFYGDWWYYERKTSVTTSEQQNSDVSIDLGFHTLTLWEHTGNSSSSANRNVTSHERSGGYRYMDGSYQIGNTWLSDSYDPDWWVRGTFWHHPQVHIIEPTGPNPPTNDQPSAYHGVYLNGGAVVTESGYSGLAATFTGFPTMDEKLPALIGTSTSTDTASSFVISLNYTTKGSYVLACDERMLFLMWVEWAVTFNGSYDIPETQCWDAAELNERDHIVSCSVKAVFRGAIHEKVIFSGVTVNKVPVRDRSITANWYLWPLDDPIRPDMKLYANKLQFAGPEVYKGIDNIFLGQGLSKDFAGYNSDEDESRMIFSKRIVLGNDGIDWMMDKYGISANLPNGTGRRYYYSDELYEKICNTTYLIQFDQSGFSDWVLNVDALPPASKGSAPDIDAICFRV